jgi:hypothetical protein
VEAGSEPRGVAFAYALTEEEAAKVAKPRPDLDALVCSFCGKSREEVPHLFTGCDGQLNAEAKSTIDIGRQSLAPERMEGSPCQGKSPIGLPGGGADPDQGYLSYRPRGTCASTACSLGTDAPTSAAQDTWGAESLGK